MMTLLQLLSGVAGYASLVIASGYSLAVLVAVLVWWAYVARPQPKHTAQPAVTILKPLCGAEPELYTHLRSFCRQDYPEYEIIFGVLDPADPALPIAQRLQQEFPRLPISIVVNPKRHGHNNKSSNLINMLARASKPILVISDSDTWVRPDYLDSVIGPVLDDSVGLVTCLSHDWPTPRVWSHLGAMYINEWYLPSVILAWLFGNQSYASGQTLCLRRSTLEAIGGLRSFADHLADDYRLGELIRGRGLRIVLSRLEVQTEHHEPDFAALNHHELRWMRTLHILRPLSFRMIFLTFSLPLALIGLGLSYGLPRHPFAWQLLGVTLLARLALHLVHRLRTAQPLLEDLHLLPAREFLICWVWCQSFFHKRVTWRGTEFEVDDTGVMRRIA
jgi:ceramide glucosyltransferase